jgi:hypothetical protein
MSLEQYKETFDAVQGWTSDKLFDTVKVMADCGINRKGGVAEIGVHHGKFFILLNQVTEEKCESWAIDVFDMQHLNIDKSGEGNKSIFMQNLAEYDRWQGRNTHVLQMDSMSLTNQIPDASLRFISIDGGHTVEHTINDLKIAERLIANEGVIILDDIMGVYWCGVTEGYIKYSMTYPTIVPFAMGHNKLYLCKLSHHEYYFNLFKPLSSGQTKFTGYQVQMV